MIEKTKKKNARFEGAEKVPYLLGSVLE